MPGTSDGWIPKTRSLNPEDYDRFRPTYPADLFTSIQQYVPITAGTRCLEIGIGTGQATDPYLEVGCEIVALEPADNLRNYARQKYASHANLAIRGHRFEELSASEQFDLIYAATSFHWVEGDDRLERLRAHLSPAGSVALFWNHPAPLDPIHAELQKVYQTYRPDRPKRSPNKRIAADAETFPEELRSAGFDDVQTRTFERTRSLTASEYIGLLHTYSDHLSMPDDTRIPLMSGIAKVIDDNGGVITIHDTIELHLARNR